tara:strand:+ start:260 stop:466 length:207 start_codon:yes stop_codon:yes gene_type:complete
MKNGSKTFITRRVDELMAEGKASRRKAWVMSEILDTIFHENHEGYIGAACRDEARQYIMDYCGITEDA